MTAAGRGGGAAHFDLTGRVAVVTGGNRGIGFGIARALGRAGATVVVWARDGEQTASAVAELEARGIVAAGRRCDVAHEEGVMAAAGSTIEQFGRIDVCVANAGGNHLRPFLETDLADWDRTVRLNLTGAFLCFRECARDMARRREGGSLVAVSSGAALRGSPEMPAYAAAKAGLGGLVRSLAVELAPLGVRVNVLLPGWTENSRMSATEVAEDMAVETLASIPAGRWGTPDDLGTAAVYLADPTLSYHTGAELRVDGGYSAVAPYIAVREATRLRSERARLSG
ncbi:MAG TPA: SDR family oxidoreductase [Acidimicrobiales bacterium]|nr:SDR family oxidoreductase [Acidimicrobiales bacterium]